MAGQRRYRFLVGIAALGLTAAAAVPSRTGTAARDDEPTSSRDATTFEFQTQTARHRLTAGPTHTLLTTSSSRTEYEVELSLVVDGVERSLLLAGIDARKRASDQILRATFPVRIGDQQIVGTLALSVDPTTDALLLSMAVTPLGGGGDHAIALRAVAVPGTAKVFVPERGELGDVGDVETRSVVIDDDAHPMAFVVKSGRFTVGERAPDLDTPGAKVRLASTFDLTGGPTRRAEVAVVVGASTEAFWGSLYARLGTPVVRVSGVVSGTGERAEIFALDEQGHPLLRVPTNAAGRFAVEAPTDAKRWYAALDAAGTSSAVVHYDPADGSDVRLRIFPSGELHARVVDDDTGAPLLARVVVRGLDRTVDPAFTQAHDFRSSGAGPLVDVRTGELTWRLPPGKYRVSALKGIEWSIDSEVVDIGSGHVRTVDLRPRHVVPTPGLVGCDLHVHARPSFDTKVTQEQRLLSLASAGIDFAVPTEHNVVGDYTAAVEHVELQKTLAHVSGIEVTTSNPPIGHFGVFPFPKNAAPIPYSHTSASALFAASRKGDPSRVLVVHHPRLHSGMGYFQVAGFDPKAGKLPSGMQTEFDVLEIYNGSEMMNRAKTEAVLADWFSLLDLGKRYAASGSSDSHKIQFQWAGYPRTYVRVEPAMAGDTGGPIDPNAVVDAVKRGRGFVTSGPLVELEASGVQPGDELVLRDRRVTGRIRVRAAPWVDVSSIEFIAGSSPIHRIEVAPRPTVTGREAGSLDEAAARAVRYDASFELAIPPGAKWLVVVVRGDRPYGDVLPFMPVQPLAFTNPIWLK